MLVLKAWLPWLCYCSSSTALSLPSFGVLSQDPLNLDSVPPNFGCPKLVVCCSLWNPTHVFKFFSAQIQGCNVEPWNSWTTVRLHGVPLHNCLLKLDNQIWYRLTGYTLMETYSKGDVHHRGQQIRDHHKGRPTLKLRTNKCKCSLHAVLEEDQLTVGQCGILIACSSVEFS